MGVNRTSPTDTPPGAHHALPWCTPYPAPGAHHALPHGWRKRVSALANAVFLGLVFRAGRCCSFGGLVHPRTLRREISTGSARENRRPAEKDAEGSCRVPRDWRIGVGDENGREHFLSRKRVCGVSSGVRSQRQAFPSGTSVRWGREPGYRVRAGRRKGVPSIRGSARTAGGGAAGADRVPSTAPDRSGSPFPGGP